MSSLTSPIAAQHPSPDPCPEEVRALELRLSEYLSEAQVAEAVPLEAFADSVQRQHWIEDKNLLVFSLWHPTLPAFEVDLEERDLDAQDAGKERRVLGRVRPSAEALQLHLRRRRARGTQDARHHERARHDTHVRH